MLNVHDVVRTHAKRNLRVLEVLAAGSEGAAYKVRNELSGTIGVIKVFETDRIDRDFRIRKEGYLMGLGVDMECQALYGTVDVGDLPGGGIFSYYRFAPGDPLSDFLAGPNPPLVCAIQIALGLVQALHVMHRHRLAHTDLHDRNMTVALEPDGKATVSIIDLSGYEGAGFQGTLGTPEFMSPEIYKAEFVDKTPLSATIESDLFSLAISLHAILLWAMPYGPLDGDDKLAALHSGRWLFDPDLPDRLDSGLPAETLNLRLMALFRRAFSLQPGERPTTAEWREALAEALFLVFCCPSCGGRVILDAGRDACPFCDRTQVPVLVAPGVLPISLGASATIVGRANLGAGALVSREHAILRRGPRGMTVEPIGGNQSCVWDPMNSRWWGLPNGQEYEIAVGSRLRLADVEVVVEAAS